MEDFYRRHGALTDPGSLRSPLQGLPPDVATLAKVVGGV